MELIEADAGRVGKFLSLRRKTLLIVVMSGYTDDSVVKSGILDHQTPFLQKPFSMEALLQKIREVLGQAAAAR